MTEISIIGNNNLSRNISDGGRIKIRLFYNLLVKENVAVHIIDLANWKTRFLSIYRDIKKAIRNKNTIVIMAGPNGSRLLLKMINKMNKHHNSKVIFCPLGIGTVDVLLKGKKTSDVQKFMSCDDFLNIKDERMKIELNKVDKIILQNNLIKKTYDSFYDLKNTHVLENFRDVSIKRKSYRAFDKTLRIIFSSRVTSNKGIFDLINAVKDLNSCGYSFFLDIYGDIQMSKKENKLFNSCLDGFVRYCGTVSFSDSVELIKQYDLFCLPTKYHGEGTSGSLIESFLSGTPALISSYNQSSLLVNNLVDGFVFEIGNIESLKKMLLYAFNNFDDLEKIGLLSQKKSIKYTYSFNRDNFLKLFDCMEIKN